MSNYEVHAQPFFINVTCPKHRTSMTELKNGFIGEKLWWCAECDKPYHLKPTPMRDGTYDKEEAYRQLREYQK